MLDDKEARSADSLRLMTKKGDYRGGMAAYRCENDLSECRIKMLPTLSELGHLVSGNGDLPEILTSLLNIMKQHMNIVRGMVNLFEADSGLISVHRSFGLSEDEAARGIYLLGEGITGKVVETGEIMVVPRVSKEPRFLNRTGSSQHPDDPDYSFLCVPILRGRKVLGAISAERLYDNQRLLELDVKILNILAATAAQTIELYLLKNVYKVALEDENQRLRQELKLRFQPSNIIGNSKAMRDIYPVIERLSHSRITVLILGESGVGKELVASAIHYNGPNGKGPFIRFNCAALSESIIESELFGHEKGAFTGAHIKRRGRFEEADGGTIFLDEIGELSLSMQAKLLRVLQEKSFERVGSNASVQVNIRILAATNRNLENMVKQGQFREDLYYRLSVFPLTVPPLRDRGNDIITLAEHFVKQLALEMGIPPYEIAPAAINLLMSYRWPGNVRELENVMERAILLAENDRIQDYNLPRNMQIVNPDELTAGGELETRIAAMESGMIVDALKKHRGNISHAAQQLGLTRRMLHLRMEKYGLDYKDFRRRKTDAGTDG